MLATQQSQVTDDLGLGAAFSGVVLVAVIGGAAIFLGAVIVWMRWAGRRSRARRGAGGKPGRRAP